MYPLLTTCPVCGGVLHVERLGCDECHSHIEGEFSLGWLGRLSREQLEFVELMVKNRGNINSVAGELRIAYNTARSRLDDIVAALGYATPIPDENGRTDRRSVLDRLAAKEISVEDAMKLLRS
ncbi:MAG: DUF2089 domain-containing protein [Kouleothrix sp.]|nr:DUF2089 domain-containing protein [Kouleothrix sp.]